MRESGGLPVTPSSPLRESSGLAPRRVRPVFRAGATRQLDLLSPRVQEGLLLGDLHLSERRIRALAATAEW